MTTMINRRRTYANNNEILPYDAQIEYLECDSHQFINTGIAPDENTGAAVKYERKSTGDVMDDKIVFGARNNISTDTRWWIGSLYNTTGLKNIYFGYGGYYSVYDLTDDNKDNVYTVHLNLYDDKVIKVFSSDDSLLAQKLLPTLSFTPTYTIAIGKGTGAENANWYFNGRIYSFKITQGDKLIMDLIPVRIDTTGYMYDKISKQLFSNSTSTPFGLGPDI